MDLAACMLICLADITSCVNIRVQFPSAVINNYDSLLINIDHMFKHLRTRHYSCGKHHKITTKNFPIRKFNIDIKVLLLKFFKLILLKIAPIELLLAYDLFHLYLILQVGLLPSLTAAPGVEPSMPVRFQS
jgi:hypothetical protein